MNWFQKLILYITMPFFRLWFKVTFHGKENLPRGGGYIQSCNHNSNMDPILLCWPKWTMVCYMSKESLFKSPLYSWFFYGVGAFPVQRGTGDTSAIDTAQKKLGQGHILGMFPEGTRHPVGEPGRPKSGLALVAKATGADVLPCAIHYSKGARFRSRVNIYFGELIPNASLFEGEDSPRQLKQATKRIWAATTDMLEEHHGIHDNRLR